jgi:hypothetical protein
LPGCQRRSMSSGACECKSVCSPSCNFCQEFQDNDAAKELSDIWDYAYFGPEGDPYPNSWNDAIPAYRAAWTAVVQHQAKRISELEAQLESVGLTLRGARAFSDTQARVIDDLRDRLTDSQNGTGADAGQHKETRKTLESTKQLLKNALDRVAELELLKTAKSKGYIDE